MFSKIKKYVIGFFVLCGGILVAFLSGRSAGKKDEKLKGLKEGDKVIVTWVGKNSYKGKLDIPQTTASYKGVKFSEFTFTWSQYTIVDENLVVKIDSSHPDVVSSIVLHLVKKQVRPRTSPLLFGTCPNDNALGIITSNLFLTNHTVAKR